MERAVFGKMLVELTKKFFSYMLVLTVALYGVTANELRLLVLAGACHELAPVGWSELVPATELPVRWGDAIDVLKYITVCFCLVLPRLTNPLGGNIL